MLSRTLAAPVLLLVVALAGCSTESADRGVDPAAEESSGAGDSQAAAPETPGQPGACEYVEDDQEPAREVSPPPADPEVSGRVDATMVLGQGEVPLTLDAEGKPCTVGSFVSLAEQGYFDGTECHRLTTANILVLQCGDPTATGTGGPGYSVPDELTGKETYPPGTLAMANTGMPDSGGSQFFVVYGETPLPPQYAVFGRLSPKGLEVVERIGAAGTADGGPDGSPKETVTIEKVTVG